MSPYGLNDASSYTPVRVEPHVNSVDAVLVLALAATPSGHNLASMTAHAGEVAAPILLLQSSDFAFEAAALTLSLGLPPDTHPQLAALLVAAAAAEIRMAADRLNASGRGAG